MNKDKAKLLELAEIIVKWDSMEAGKETGQLCEKFVSMAEEILSGEPSNKSGGNDA